MEDAVIEGIRERVAAAIRVNQSVGIQVPENRHGDLLEAVFNSMLSNTQDTWTFVTVSKTFGYLAKTFKEGTQRANIKFIDCISRAAGISELLNNCNYIESPVMLEKIILEILNNFKGIKREADKYVVIDSVSALMIYNDPEIIREFISLLMNRSRSENIHIISILVEEEMDSNKLIQLNDKIIVLRDSFID
jgi:KaiC/GvpD/RAD55 family RecA-like ATPase